MMNTVRRNTKMRRNTKKRREAQLRKRIFFVCMAFTVMIVSVLMISGLKNVSATNNSENPVYKYYTSYEIQPGDTLTSIAQKYTVNSNVSVQEYIREVKKNNQLVSDKITSGKYLVISYYSDEYK